MSWRLMPWFVASLGHQQYSLCRIRRSMSSHDHGLFKKPYGKSDPFAFSSILIYWLVSLFIFCWRVPTNAGVELGTPLTHPSNLFPLDDSGGRGNNLRNSYQIRKIAGSCAGNAGNVFPAIEFKPLVSVTHLPWRISVSLTRGGGENVPGILGACTTRNFTYQAKGP